MGMAIAKLIGGIAGIIFGAWTIVDGGMAVNEAIGEIRTGDFEEMEEDKE